MLLLGRKKYQIDLAAQNGRQNLLGLGWLGGKCLQEMIRGPGILRNRGNGGEHGHMLGGELLL